MNHPVGLDPGCFEWFNFAGNLEDLGSRPFSLLRIGAFWIYCWLWWTKVKSHYTRAVVRKNDNLWKSLGGIVVNGAPREVPLSTQWSPSGVYWRSPRGFLLANPRPHPRPDPRPKTLGAYGPSGFWPWVWPRGAFNILPRDSIENSRKPP